MKNWFYCNNCKITIHWELWSRGIDKDIICPQCNKKLGHFTSRDILCHPLKKF
jgi:hypothetical protein